MTYFIIIAMVFLLHLLLKMSWITTGIVLLLAFVALPFHRKENEKRKQNETRFAEASLYLDTILYAFLKEEKIEGAIRDAALTLPEGNMKKVVSMCHEKLLMTTEDAEVMEESMAEIAKEFSCKRIKDVHSFMLHVEYYGGEIEKPVKLLLEDKSRWEGRIKRTIEERKKKMTDIILSVVTSVLICSVILYLPVMNVDISQNPVLQVLTVIVLLIDDLIVFRAQKYLSVDWLSMPLPEEKDYYVKKMQSFKNYDEKREKRNSLIWGGIALVISVILFLLAHQWAAALGMLLSVFLFNQHRVGKGILRKTIVKEIKYAFPNWLMDIVLLLQSENVQMALYKSRAHVPGILKEELEGLLAQLEMEPESSQPYHMFLKDFSIPEVHSAMSGLYAISIGNSGKGDRQVGELIGRNLELLDITESKRLSDSGSGMYLLFFAPVLTASFKLVIDMAILMIYFIQSPML